MTDRPSVFPTLDAQKNALLYLLDSQVGGLEAQQAHFMNQAKQARWGAADLGAAAQFDAAAERIAEEVAKVRTHRVAVEPYPEEPGVDGAEPSRVFGVFDQRKPKGPANGK